MFRVNLGSPNTPANGSAPQATVMPARLAHPTDASGQRHAHAHRARPATPVRADVALRSASGPVLRDHWLVVGSSAPSSPSVATCALARERERIAIGCVAHDWLAPVGSAYVRARRRGTRRDERTRAVSEPCARRAFRFEQRHICMSRRVPAAHAMLSAWCPMQWLAAGVAR